MDTIDCIVFNSPADARLWEISENLHRAELTVLEYSEHIAEWLKLTDAKGAQVAQVSAKGGRGVEGGLSAATRELGIDRTEAQRAIKIDALSPEAKVIAVEVGLDDNQSVLLETARQPDAENQVATIKAEAARRAHVANNSGKTEWYTPSVFIELATEVMGRIDVDPASSEIANRTVGATTFYDAAADGLKQTWAGKVWMNPPYAQPLIAEFSEAIVEKYKSGEATEACVLVNNATETAWFQTLLSRCKAVCFVRTRIKFLDPTGNPSGAPLQGQAIVYFANALAEFCGVFADVGIVLSPGGAVQ